MNNIGALERTGEPYTQVLETYTQVLVGPCDNHVEIFSKELPELQKGTDFILKFTKIEIETSHLSSKIIVEYIRRQTGKNRSL